MALMDYAPVDRAPYFEEGLRPEVIEAWKDQGHVVEARLSQLPPGDTRVELQPDLFPRPLPNDSDWPMDAKGYDRYFSRLKIRGQKRFKDEWPDKESQCCDGESVRMLRVSRGFFQAMGVFSWQRFYQVMKLTIQDPGLVHDVLQRYGLFLTAIARRLLEKTQVEAAVFSEPIGGNTGPLISPKMYRDLVLPGYVPLMRELKEQGVRWFIFRTYANARALIPVVMQFGFNCLWACEVNLQAMDYLDIRREFGRDLRLIGGIDLDALRQGGRAIQQELRAKLPPLLADGGYIPLADGRVRQEVPFKNYLQYREMLAELAG